jgi:hypothetical protein
MAMVTVDFKIQIDGEKYTVTEVYTGGSLPMITTDSGEEFYLAKDSEEAGEAAAEYWRDMARNDRKEFACIIGEERLVQWALGESDSFGISSLDEFCDVNATVPEENFASYDHQEREVTRCGKLSEELGFMPTVAYRHN